MKPESIKNRWQAMEPYEKAACVLASPILLVIGICLTPLFVFVLMAGSVSKLLGEEIYWD